MINKHLLDNIWDGMLGNLFFAAICSCAISITTLYLSHSSEKNSHQFATVDKEGIKPREMIIHENIRFSYKNRLHRLKRVGPRISGKNENAIVSILEQCARGISLKSDVQNTFCFIPLSVSKSVNCTSNSFHTKELWARVCVRPFQLDSPVEFWTHTHNSRSYCYPFMPEMMEKSSLNRFMASIVLSFSFFPSISFYHSTSFHPR